MRRLLPHRTLTNLFNHLFQFNIFLTKPFIFNLILFRRFFIALNRRKRHRRVKRCIQPIQIPKQMCNFLLKERKFNEVEWIFVRFDVIYDLNVDFLKDEVEFIEDLAFDLEEYVFVGFVHFWNQTVWYYNMGKSIKKITIRGVGECTCLTSWEASVVCRRLCRG